MNMQGTRQIACAQQAVWAALNDPAILKQCIQGCDKFEAAGDNQYQIGMSVKIGPVSAKFSGKVSLSDISAPDSYTIAFEGQGGPAGFGKGSAQVALATKDGGTELSYTVQASIGGKIAQLGQRLVDGAAKAMAEDFFKRFDALMQAQNAPVADAAAPAAAPAAEAPKAAPVPTWVWVAGAAVLAAAWLLMR